MKVNIEKKKLSYMGIGLALVAAVLISYNYGVGRASKNAEEVVKSLSQVMLIDVDYINSLNALRQRTLEWGQIQERIAVATESAEQIAQLRQASDDAVKDIEELTKLVIVFKTNRENFINESGNLGN